ncbi:hypothetical protein WMY93_000938 [Mugilogobius chulae]|uniref:DH domain-containing protein n=1 Tax=Mugilogobius chulae TaxID=88201 RepID=A0AAW0Q3X3_9GOBI
MCVDGCVKSTFPWPCWCVVRGTGPTGCSCSALEEWPVFLGFSAPSLNHEVCLSVTQHRRTAEVTDDGYSKNPHHSTQMDELDVRLKFSSEEPGAESINDQGQLSLHAAAVELENDALNLEAETWSLAVDQSFVKELSKETVKRQEVIYELMQTEMHHVRTLKILFYVYMYELKQSSLVDDSG